MKKSIKLLSIMLLLLFVFTSCSSNKLNGTYVSEEESIEITFNSDGTVKWIEDDFVYKGTYEYNKEEDLYYLEIKGFGMTILFRFEKRDNDTLVQVEDDYEIIYTKK